MMSKTVHLYLVFNEACELVDQVATALDTEEYMEANPDVRHIVDIANGSALDNLLKLQWLFQARLGQMPVMPEERTQYVMNNMLYAEAEGHEFLREIEGFKSWKHYDWSTTEKDEHYKAALEEFVDMLHFVLNIALAMDFSAEDIYRSYIAKNIVNHARQDNGY